MPVRPRAWIGAFFIVLTFLILETSVLPRLRFLPATAHLLSLVLGLLALREPPDRAAALGLCLGVLALFLGNDVTAPLRFALVGLLLACFARVYAPRGFWGALPGVCLGLVLLGLLRLLPLLLGGAAFVPLLQIAGLEAAVSLLFYPLVYLLLLPLLQGGRRKEVCYA